LFGVGLRIAVSFGAEDIVLVHLALRHAPRARLFTLDTGRLHPETYEVMDLVRRRLGAAVEVFAPSAAATSALMAAQGAMGMRDSVEARKACCRVRKLEPLARALDGADAWATGLRRGQSDARATVDVVAMDGARIKLSPLAHWSRDDVWAYVRAHRLPYNPLHDVGYPSIGCAPCTRAVSAIEDERAGRWWWEQDQQKECGLHVHQ